MEGEATSTRFCIRCYHSIRSAVVVTMVLEMLSVVFDKYRLIETKLGAECEVIHDGFQWRVDSRLMGFMLPRNPSAGREWGLKENYRSSSADQDLCLNQLRR